MPKTSTSRSPSPSRRKTKAKDPLANVCGARTALLVPAVWWSVMGILLLVASDVVIGKMYRIPLKELKQDKEGHAQVNLMWQSMGLWMLIAGSTMTYTARVGNKNTMGLLCGGNIVSHALLFAIVLLKMKKACEDLAMPVSGTYLNLGLMATFSFLSLCGWTASGKPTPTLGLLTSDLSSKSSVAFRYAILLCFTYGPLMLFNDKFLLEQYGVKSSGSVPKFYKLIFIGFGGTLLTAGISWVCMLSADAKTTKDGIRALWAVMFAQFVAQACMKTSIELMGHIALEGVYVNLLLWFVGTLLAYRAMVF